MSQSRIPSKIIRHRFNQTTHKVLDSTKQPKAGFWPDVNNPIPEIDTDFRFGLPGNGGHECLQKIPQEQKFTINEVMDMVNQFEIKKNVDMDNDFQQKLDRENIPTDLPSRVHSVL